MKWLSDFFGPRELAPSDMIVQELRRRFVADARWLRIFGDPSRIRAVPILLPRREGAAAEHLLTPLANAETPIVSGFGSELRIYSILRFEVMPDESLEAGEPGVATLLDYARSLISGAGNIAIDTPMGAVEIARRNLAGGQTYRWEPSASGAVYEVGLEWIYEVTLDPTKRRVQALVDAGYYGA